MKFEGDVILVVGAACGMGNATALQLLGEGAQVIGFDLREDALQELADDAKDLPGTFTPFVGDVTDKAKRTEVLALVKERFGKLDTLAYVAGTLDLMTPPQETDDELWDYVMDVNVSSAFKLTRDAIPLLADHEGKAANIVVVASIGGIFGSTAGAAYTTSKHAVIGLTQNLGWSLRDHNVRVNTVCPGAVATSILENAMLKWPDREPMCESGMKLYATEGAVSLGEGIMGEPEDIANAICFLISEDSQFIDGAVLRVDGGWTTF